MTTPPPSLDLRTRFGPVGAWSAELRGRDRTEAAEAAALLDELGYPAVWVPGVSGGDLFGDVTALLAGAPRIAVATAVVNVWMHPAADTAHWHADTAERFPGRLLLGLGISHAASIDGPERRWDRPLARMADYLDELGTVPPADIVLAALGPKMLALAAQRTAGSHTYFVTPEHTAAARGAMGPAAFLAPELKVVLESDPARARAAARRHLSRTLPLPNYRNNLLRSGFTEVDVEGAGSDRLVDRVVAWGSVDAVGARVREHLDAGADHVGLHVVTDDPQRIPTREWRELAGLVQVAPTG